MRIVVAPDKFEGSQTAPAVAGRFAAGLRTQLPDARRSCREVSQAAGFEKAYALTDLGPDVTRCMTEAGPLVERPGEIVAGDLAKQARAEPLSETK